MARDNKISATFRMEAGDGASAFEESLATTAFTSGDAVVVQGTVGTTERFFAAEDYGMGQFDGIFVENRDDTNHLEVDLFTTQDSTTSLFASGKHFEVAPGGCFLIRFDAAMDAILCVGLTGEAADVEFTLCLAE